MMGKAKAALKLRRQLRRRLLVERLGERRVLASITGTVFEDVDLSMQREAGEPAAAHRVIYLDSNDNASLDVGESFVVSEENGSFHFDGLADGDYVIRLFNGTSTQQQTVPVEATPSGKSLEVDGGTMVHASGPTSLVLSSNALVTGNTQSGQQETIAVGDQLSQMQTLPDGRVLVLGQAETGESAWIVDPSNSAVESVDLGGGAFAHWNDLAIDGSGRGVALRQDGNAARITALDGSAAGGPLQASTTDVFVPADAQVISSHSGPRSVFAWSGSDGLELSLWSNATSSFISTEPQSAPGTTAILAFDDASGLLALQTENGGVSIRDINNQSSPLLSLDQLSGPVAIDGNRELLVSFSTTAQTLHLTSLRDGSRLAEMAVDLSSVGQVAAVTLNEQTGDVVLLGSKGTTQLALQEAAAHRVNISGGQDAEAVLFGLAMTGLNDPPAFQSVPQLEVDEDEVLVKPAPTARTGSSDPQSDQYIVLQEGTPAHGTAVVRIDGSLQYTPQADFFGTDEITVRLHDGRDLSDAAKLTVIVNPVPDSPEQVIVTLNPLPENALPGFPLGTIEIIDADGIGGGHIIEINDSRLQGQGNQIIIVEGEFDFETEPEVPLVITVIDTETEAVYETITAATVTDQNEPITAILPTEAEVYENEPGASIVLLDVVDEDMFQTHELTVDDSRFEIREDRELKLLKLVDGVALDFEEEPEVVVNVTATEEQGGNNSFTEAITIRVIDVPEQPSSIELSNRTVTEHVPGDAVGEVIVDGRAVDDRYEVTVDDPRFEIANSTLKLLDDQIVERASQDEIQLTITARDSQGIFSSIQETFVIEVLENDEPAHNHENPYDVDHSGTITSVDALVIINYLNSFGPGPLIDGQGDPSFCYDVNADGMITALDALLVLNEINRIENGGGGIVGGEQQATPEGEEQGDSTPITPEKQWAAAPDADKSLAEPLTTPPEGEFIGPVEAPHDRAVSDWNEDHRRETKTLELIASNDRDQQAEFAECVDETLRLLNDAES